LPVFLSPPQFQGKGAWDMFFMRIILCAIVILFSRAEARCADKSLKQVSFVSLWLPQAQFAGYYVALEKGIYKKYGLEVTIIDGGPDHPPFKLLEEGKVDFSVMWLSTGIEKKSQGVPLVNIAQIVQKSGLMLVAKKSSGIKSPEDLNNKKVGLWDADFEIQPRAFFKKYNLKVKVVPQSYTVNLFLRDGVDVASAMWYNEYHTIINSGYDPGELTTFFFYDYGLNAPEDGIYTLEKTVINDPATCRAFVKASLEGWRYAFENTDETVDIVLKYMEKAHLPANRVHQKWMLERMRDLVSVNGTYDDMGSLSADDYHKVGESLQENGLIKEIPGFAKFYENCATDDKK
jgi:NitT/TauT family transport system substrate-binding protein